jgi:hypothetical protein
MATLFQTSGTICGLEICSVFTHQGRFYAVNANGMGESKLRCVCLIFQAFIFNLQNAATLAPVHTALENQDRCQVLLSYNHK